MEQVQGFGMNTEIVAARELGADEIGERTDAHL
jgi:hypothetical protein